MFFQSSLLVLPAILGAIAAPIPAITDVTINQQAAAEAQQRDNTATRAFTAVPITTSDGQCFFVDPASGDFRENLTPVQIKPCDGSAGQKWDVITSGKHQDTAGQALIVSSLTNACLNFDPRRAAGNQVLLFSCGGRGDGGGAVTNSQQFAFTGQSKNIALVPNNADDKTCLTVKNGLLDQTDCDPKTASGDELFTIGGGASSASAGTGKGSKGSAGKSAAAAPPAADPTPAPAAAATKTAASAVVTVSRAGTVLNPSAAAEANPRDNTATRAASGAQIKTSGGQCLSIDPTAGDFRENLIPVQVKTCDAADAGQKFDVITAGVHNNVKGQALIVSSETQGCLNFDPRRAAGDQVILFSCGGRADGGGAVTDSQLFAFSGGKTLALSPQNADGKTCLAPSGGVLAPEDCNAAQPSATQLFTIA